MSNTLRITGMASGLDVDSIVQKMMKGQNMRLDKMKQDRQTTQWKQDIYRDILGDISSFKSTYFDLINPDKNMLSANTFTAFDVNSDTTSAATATAFGNAATGTYTLSDIILAKAATTKGTSVVKIGTKQALRSDKMSAVISGKVEFSIENGKKADGTTNAVSLSYDFSGSDKDKTIDSIMKDISTKTGLNASFSELGGVFSLSKKETGDEATFKMEWKSTDANTEKFMGLFGGSGGLISEKGNNASVKITNPNGLTNRVTKANNSFSIDGVNYNLLQNTVPATDVTADTEPAAASTQTVKINVAANSKNVVDKLKEYISKYNDIVGKIQTTLTEKKDRNYTPLTDEQRKGMKDEEIKTWETKAKKGLLKGDNELQGLLYGMRSALFSSAQGVGINMTDIGLDTSQDRTSGGKIIIKDETKLNNYVLNNGDKVAELFTKTSTSVPEYSKTLTATEKQTRLKEEGIFQAIYDTLQDYTSTIGGKGSLLQKAGIKGDFTEYKNLLTDDLNDRDKTIKEMIKKLADKEEKYYLQFSKLEQAMQQMNSQQSWLSQQLGGGK